MCDDVACYQTDTGHGSALGSESRGHLPASGTDQTVPAEDTADPAESPEDGTGRCHADTADTDTGQPVTLRRCCGPRLHELSRVRQ